MTYFGYGIGGCPAVFSGMKRGNQTVLLQLLIHADTFAWDVSDAMPIVFQI